MSPLPCLSALSALSAFCQNKDYDACDLDEFRHCNLEPTMNLTANASRLGLRIQETLSEHARELNFGVSSNAALFDTPEVKINDIRRQLDGSNDRETLEGLKRLIAVGVSLVIKCTSVLFDVDDFERPRCIPILRTSRQKCCLPQPGNPEARLHLHPAICGIRTRPRLALD
jgi:hypothetical protein